MNEAGNAAVNAGQGISDQLFGGIAGAAGTSPEAVSAFLLGVSFVLLGLKFDTVGQYLKILFFLGGAFLILKAIGVL